ncbi:MAG TPA: DNA polymerase I, partial [Lachnospiraceae bacterium]|nr:DNA polymerase I [Lachnospiraceae bacterium]
MAKNQKLVLIDGHSILHRAFYGVQDLTNAQGLHTNAIYGFLNIMFRFLEEEKPDYLAVAFDVHAPTFRHQMYEPYKGTRKPMPEELREQVPVMKDVLRAMRVVIVEQEGLEADDILGTLAKKAQAEGMEVTLISGDRDLLQVADEHIKIRIPKTKMGKTEVEDYYPEDVQAAYQVTPIQFIDLKALMGDTADNIPGVPKVGQKTATELMVQYGSLENIYAHVEEITKKSIRESLIQNRELADLSKVLATIRVDSDVELDYDAAKAEGFYTQEAYDLFKQLEFKQMLSRFEKENVSRGGDIAKTFRKLEEQKEFLGWLKKRKAGSDLGLFLALEDGKLLGAAASSREETVVYILPVQENVQLSLFEEIPGEGTGNTDAADADMRQLSDGLLALSERVKLSVFDIKRYYRYIAQESTDKYFDILIAAYLLNPLKSDYDLEAIAAEHLGLTIPGRGEIFGKKKLHEAAALMPEQFAEYCCYGAYVSAAVAEVLEKKLEKAGMDKLMRDMEMPLSLVLYDMEREGVEVRREELKAYGDALVERIEELEQSIHAQAGVKFNINSPKQLGEVLFDTMKLPGGKKTKTGYSTAADVL